MAPAIRRLVVVGSLNVDLVAVIHHLPEPGETILSSESLAVLCGGKGANQAMSAARLGALTAIVGRVGNDAYGARLRDALERDGVDCSGVSMTPDCSSGVALIAVDEAGRNSIIVSQGANARLSPDDVAPHLADLGAGSVVALQLEIPLHTVYDAACSAHARGSLVVLNPAPPRELPDALLKSVDVLVLNESEAAAIAGMPVDSVEDARRAAGLLRERGAACVVVTLGARGALLADGHATQLFAAHAASAVDTTGAGDTFVGGLCVGLLAGRDLAEAIALGQSAAAIQVTRRGAQAAMPYRHELNH